MRYPPTLRNLCNDTIPDAQLGSSGSVTAPARAATQEGFVSETRHLSVNVPEEREPARHDIAESWEMDARTKAVLMFVSPPFQLEGFNRPYFDLVTDFFKRLASFPLSSRHLSLKPTRCCCRPTLETGHLFLLAKSLRNLSVPQVAHPSCCRPVHRPLQPRQSSASIYYGY